MKEYSLNIQSNIYNGMYNLKILCARQSACDLHNPAPLHWVEGWVDAIQWLDLSTRRTIHLFLLTWHIGFRITIAIAFGGPQNVITKSGSRLYTSRKIS